VNEQRQPDPEDDLPYVDGRAATPEELRAEVARANDPQVQAIEEIREDVAATLDELSSRLSVRRQVTQHLPAVRTALIAVGGLLGAVVLWRWRASRRRPGS
jgi:hypothetical protein